MRFALFAIAAFAFPHSVSAQEAEPAPVTPTSVVAAAQDSEWLPIAPDDLLVMDLAPDDRGNDRRVVIQLIPPPFSQPWVENIRTLARAHWWDGTSVNRVQDNYVTQWGDVTEEKPLPVGLHTISGECFDIDGALEEPCAASDIMESYAFLMQLVVNEMDIENGQSDRQAGSWTRRDSYATAVQFAFGWPIAADRDPGTERSYWPIHCYGYVGVGRNYAPDTGTGAELYTIIGQPQRHMDRNLAVVGRIIDGMEHLSSLPRGSGELGFYTEEEAHLRTPILSVRLATDMENAPTYEYLSTESQSFAAYVAVRANRDDAFYTVPAGGVDVCNVEVPIRRVGG